MKSEPKSPLLFRDFPDAYRHYGTQPDAILMGADGSTYVFKEETASLFDSQKVDEVFDCTKGHPLVLKKFLSGNISPETMVIYDKIFLFGNDFDKKLQDPVWETVSKKLKKYSPFLNIDVPYYKNILKQIVLGSK